MKTRFALAWIVLSLLPFSNWAQKAEKRILEMLQKQVKAWNRGDIKKYMAGYWKSDSVVFISPARTTYGWDKVYKNYKKSYPSREKMGTLRFSDVKLTPISQGQYFMTGKWHLERNAGNIGGQFQLLWRKIEEKWVIVMDYTT